MKIILFLCILLSAPLVFANNNLLGKKILCTEFLWGFEFISDKTLYLISTDINNETNIKKYYYEYDSKLSYVNLYLNKIDTTNFIYSIHLKTLRIDVWTMTSGGNTTREFIPQGFCKYLDNNNLVEHIQDLKK